MDIIKGEHFIFTSTNGARRVIWQRLQTLAMMRSFNRPNSQFRYFKIAKPPEQTLTGTNAPSWTVIHDTRPAYFYSIASRANAFDAIHELCDPNPPRRTYGECFGAAAACVWYGAAQGLMMGVSPDAARAEFNTVYPGALVMDPKMEPKTPFINTRLANTNELVPGDWVVFKTL